MKTCYAFCNFKETPVKCVCAVTGACIKVRVLIRDS